MAQRASYIHAVFDCQGNPLSRREFPLRLLDYAAPDLVALDLTALDKPAVLLRLVDMLVKAGRVREGGPLVAELLKREAVMSTGIGGGIAIPHALSSEVESLTLVFGRTRQAMDFQASDALPVDLLFMIVGPKSASGGVYVKLLARVGRLLQNEAFKERLRQSQRAEDVIEAFQSEAEYAQ